MKFTQPVAALAGLVFLPLQVMRLAPLLLLAFAGSVFAHEYHDDDTILIPPSTNAEPTPAESAPTARPEKVKPATKDASSKAKPGTDTAAPSESPAPKAQ